MEESRSITSKNALIKKSADEIYVFMTPQKLKDEYEARISMIDNVKKWMNRQIKIDSGYFTKDYYPVIGTNGPCKININVGGKPFHHLGKELENGLL